MSVVARMVAAASRGEGIQAAAAEEKVMGLRRSSSSGEGSQSVAQRLNQFSTPPSSPRDKRAMTVLQHRERENRTRELPLAIAPITAPRTVALLAVRSSCLCLVSAGMCLAAYTEREMRNVARCRSCESSRHFTWRTLTGAASSECQRGIDYANIERN